ncbi:MAG: heparinase II/III domain-containing protein [Candidatus Kapaibacteriales bacterium]
MWLNKIRKIRQIPFEITLEKGIKAFRTFLRPNSLKKVAEEIIRSPRPDWFSYIDKGYFQLKEFEFLIDYREKIENFANLILQHKFNLLGSGWINRNFKQTKDEILSKIPNFWRAKAETITTGLENLNYHYINFWSDPLTNYEWAPNFYLNLNPIEGAEIKQGWELGRMQHLPILAYSFALGKFDGDKTKGQIILNEFESQILDFIATNPPCYSIQWSSPMDVGIRLVNWLVSYDLFHSLDANFSNFFLNEFIDSLYRHILFLLKNLEWSEGLRANHYFANITSLAVASGYIPFSDLQMQLFVFSLQEIINETLYQFSPDGGNFESSLMYHLQVAEMLLLALYFLLNTSENIQWNLNNFKIEHWYGIKKVKPLKNQKFKFDTNKKKIILPEEFTKRVQEIIRFSLSFRKSNNEFDQIGDNDSGRILRLDYFLEANEDKLDNLLKFNILWALQKNLMGIQSNTFYEALLSKRNKFFSSIPIQLKRETKGLTIQYFNHFGLAFAKSKDYFLTFRCGDIGQKGKGGHSHNDQLSITFHYHGKDFIIDPGTFCYTKSSVDRNRYRSVMMHNTLIFENEEQNLWDNRSYDDLFWITKHRTKARIIEISENRIIGEHYAYGRPARREIYFLLNQIQFFDSLPKRGNKKIHLHLHPDVNFEIKSNTIYLKIMVVAIAIEFEIDTINVEDYFYSPHYGVAIPSKRIVVQFTNTQLGWKINLQENLIK